MRAPTPSGMLARGAGFGLATCRTRVGWGIGIALLLATARPALGGRNGGGVILVHTNDLYSYSSATVCTTTLGELADCMSAVSRSDKTEPAISTIWFIAAFVPTATPEVSSIYFGTNVDQVNLDVWTRFKFCGPAGTSEATEETWPYDAGCSLGLGSPVTSTIFRFYYFGVSNSDSDPAPPNPWWCAGIAPTGGYAAFYDSAFPPTEDRITQFGCVKWYEAGLNVCPEPPMPGACCLPNTTCQIVSYGNDCVALGGTYQGDGSVCNIQCGACCFWQTTTDRRCVVTSEVDCYNDGTWDQIKVTVEGDIVGAEWSGGGNECLSYPPGTENQVYCINPNESGHGACCDAEGNCIRRYPGDCMAPDIWIGDTGCTPNPCSVSTTGACCSPDGSCILSTEPECLASGIWQGADITCSPDPCLTGACCVVAYCVRLTEPECVGYGGNYLGNATLCSPNPCPQAGACCQIDGSCRYTVEASCASPTGWLGAGVPCSPNPCMLGACCAPDGSCSVTTQGACSSPSTWEGPATVCSPNPCPRSGVCCGPDGTCRTSTEANCLPPYTWNGVLTLCYPNPCPPAAACCHSDGTCVVTLEAGCTPPNIWQGVEGATCAPNLCFTGACCLAGYCLRCGEPECSHYGGIYEGNGHLCEPNPCLTSGIEAGSQDMHSLRLSAIPNPSSGDVLIHYQLPAPSVVTLEVFNAGGSLVRRTSEGARPAGQYVVSWNALDSPGHLMPSGVYLVRVTTNEGARTTRVVIAK